MKLFKYLFLTALIAAIPLNAQILINEFMAKNVSTYSDMVDLSDYADWIELYNKSYSELTLNGYYLTDDLAVPLKWEIPAGTKIPARGYLLIWADGEDAAPGDIRTRNYWPWDNFTIQSLHANFKLSADGESIGLFKAAGSATVAAVQAGAVWKYSDEGKDLGISWRDPDFDDSNWKSGAAQLGYGDGDEATSLSYGGDSGNKYPTYYFRHKFNVTDAAAASELIFQLLRDDGAIVYLNGTEVIRSNMPNGSVNYYTYASATIGGSDEDIFNEFKVSTAELISGENTLAVEIHQRSGNSSDISFDMSLTIKNSAPSSNISVIDSLVFEHQTADVSYGRKISDQSWSFFGEPTPGLPNTTESVTQIEYSPDVTFSHTGGFYDSPITLEIETSAPSTKIVYTTDGSVPYSHSKVYSSGIYLDKNTVIRARAVSSEKLPGKVVTETFLFNEPSSVLPVFSISADSAALWDDDKGLYKNSLKKKEVPVHIDYYSTDKTRQFSIDAGVKIGGYNIWRFAQKPLNFYLRNDYGPTPLNYKLFDKKSNSTFYQFELRNGGDNWATTLLQDAMTEALLDGQMQNGIQAYKPCIVYLNGEYWGIHNLREKFDDQYFSSNFNVFAGDYEYLRTNLYPPDSHLDMEAEVGSLDAYNSMIDYLSGLDLTLPENIGIAESLVDINNFIDFITAEDFVCNTSWRHNREWWRKLSGDTRWKWLLADIDRGFNISKVNYNILDNLRGEYDLFKVLLQNDEFKRHFIQRFAAHLNSTFHSDRVIGIIDSLSAQIADEIPRHAERWKNNGGISSKTKWLQNLGDMVDFTRQRGAIALNQMQTELGAGSLVDLTINLNTDGGTIFIEGVPMTVTTAGMKFFAGMEIELKAVPKPGYVFEGWDGIATADSIRILLEGDRTITANFSARQVNIISGEITGVKTLAKSGSPYLIIGEILVHSGSELSVDSGVELLMYENANITVRGKLTVNGTETDPVMISANKSAGAKTWQGIYIDNASDSSSISNTVIRDGRGGENPLIQPAVITSINSTVSLTGLDFAGSQFPIFIRGGNVSLRNSVLQSDLSGDYINVKSGAAKILGNKFYGNKAPDTDAIDLDGDTNAVVENNVIFNFSGFNSDAIDIGEKSQNILIRYNQIYNIRDKGISVGQKSSVSLFRNLIVGCYSGIAVKDESAAVVDQNTFYGNNYAVAAFEKNFGNGGGTISVKNSILSSSKNSSFFVDKLSGASIKYSISDTDILPDGNNLFGDPLFTNPANYNFELKPGSVCVDAGDPGSKLDADQSAADIGAYVLYDEESYPRQFRKNIQPEVVINEIMYNDNTAYNSGDWIELYNRSDKEIDISGWKITDEDSAKFFVFPEGSVLGVDSFAVLCRKVTDFQSVYSGISNVFGDLSFGFDGHDKVLLLNSRDSLVSRVTYTNTYPWEPSADGGGFSLELRNPAYSNYASANWSASLAEGGTPGRKNSTFGLTSVDDSNLAPTAISLEQNYPNPFNPATNIPFYVSQTTKISIIIYDMLGRLVSIAAQGEFKTGRHIVTFNAEQFSSGIYIYVLKSANHRIAKKMILLR